MILALKSCAWLQLAKTPQCNLNAAFMLFTGFLIFRLLEHKVLANKIKRSSPEAAKIAPVLELTKLAWSDAHILLIFNPNHAA